MTKKQLLLLIAAFLLGLYLSKLVMEQSQTTGPDQASVGTFAAFEFTPQQGTYHIVTVIVVDGKLQVLVKTFVNGSDGEIKPLPPVPPTPDTSLAEWVKTKLPLLVKNHNMATERLLVAQCFDQTIQKIDNDTIKTAQNARTQLQIALTMSLAFASDTAIEDWQPFLTPLSQQMANELGSKANDIDAVKAVFKTVADALKGLKHEVRSLELQPECDNMNAECAICPIDTKNPAKNSGNSIFQQPTRRSYRLFR